MAHVLRQTDILDSPMPLSPGSVTITVTPNGQGSAH
jgi:hypothetical protein